jgi:intergrase/recombinase
MLEMAVKKLDSEQIDHIPSYNAIRLACRKRGINMDMRFCRKIYGSWLHQYGGVTAEEVDFLQGRTSPSVFSRQYLTPSNSLRTRVLESIGKLKQAIEQ